MVSAVGLALRACGAGPRRGTLSAMRRACVWILSCVVLLWLVACSADGVEHAEPTVETVGAFVARREGDSIRLYRTLGWLRLQDGDTVLEMIAYEPAFGSFAEASRAARRRDVPVKDTSASFLASVFQAQEVRVVWFRTLDEHERGIL